MLTNIVSIGVQITLNYCRFIRFTIIILVKTLPNHATFFTISNFTYGYATKILGIRSESGFQTYAERLVNGVISIVYYFKPVKVELKAGPLRPQLSKYGPLSEVKGQEPASLRYVYSAFSLKTL